MGMRIRAWAIAGLSLGLVFVAGYLAVPSPWSPVVMTALLVASFILNRVLERRAAARGDVKAMIRRGLRLSRSGRLNEAEPLFRRAAEAGSLGAMASLAEILAESGRLEESQRWYQRAYEAGITGAP